MRRRGWISQCAFAVLIAAAACTWSAPVPRSFEECERAGYPVMESYPRRCSVPGGPTFTEPWAGPPQITPAPDMDGRIRQPEDAWGEAYVEVEEIVVEPLGGNPTAVQVRLIGSLGDPCTYIFPVRQSYSDHVVALDLRAWHEVDVACIAVLEPFDIVVPLERPLTAGSWSVEAGGLTANYLVPGFDD